MHLSSTFAAGLWVEELTFAEMDLAVMGTACAPSTGGWDGPGSGKRVLIVDDDPGILMLVSKMVLLLGFHPKTAVDGLDALKTLAKYACRLVITDDDMPAMDGYQLAEQIQKRHADTPVVIMTGIQEGERLNALVASGLVAGRLLKPFNLKKLRIAIKKVTDQRPD
jgi:DNA-binding NtrC family response regulator